MIADQARRGGVVERGDDLFGFMRRHARIGIAGSNDGPGRNRLPSAVRGDGQKIDLR